MDLIRLYYFCEEKGAYTEIGSVPSGPKGEGPHGPRYIVFHPTLDICYVVNELGSNTTVFGFDREAAAEAVAAASGEGASGGVVSRSRLADLDNSTSTSRLLHPTSLTSPLLSSPLLSSHMLILPRCAFDALQAAAAAAAAAEPEAGSESKRGNSSGVASFACSPERALAAQAALKKR